MCFKLTGANKGWYTVTLHNSTQRIHLGMLGNITDKKFKSQNTHMIRLICNQLNIIMSRQSTS